MYRCYMCTRDLLELFYIYLFSIILLYYLCERERYNYEKYFVIKEYFQSSLKKRIFTQKYMVWLKIN